jgi:hypothetical protein
MKKFKKKYFYANEIHIYSSSKKIVKKENINKKKKEEIHTNKISTTQFF